MNRCKWVFIITISIFIIISCGISFYNPFKESTSLTSGLLSYWKSDTIGSFSDAHNNNDGIIQGATYTGSGKINGAYDYDGKDDLIDIPNDILPDSRSYSITAWFYIKGNNSADAGPEQVIIDLRGQYNTYVVYQEEDEPDWPGSLMFNVCYGAAWGRARTPDHSISFNTWYHFAATYVNNKIKLYVNGELNDSVSGVNPPSQWTDLGYNDSFIGKDYNTNYPLRGYFYGTIDEIGIWERELSSYEVSKLYNKGVGLSYDNFY